MLKEEMEFYAAMAELAALNQATASNVRDLAEIFKPREEEVCDA